MPLLGLYNLGTNDRTYGDLIISQNDFDLVPCLQESLRKSKSLRLSCWFTTYLPAAPDRLAIYQRKMPQRNPEFLSAATTLDYQTIFCLGGSLPAIPDSDKIEITLHPNSSNKAIK